MSGIWVSKPGTKAYELQVRALENVLTFALAYLDQHPEHEDCFNMHRDESFMYNSQKKPLI